MTRLIATMAAVVLLVAACGSGDADPTADDPPASSGDTADVEETDVDETSVERDDTDTGVAETDDTETDDRETDDGDTDDGEPSSTGDDADPDAGDGHYPLTLTHAFGETTIETEPERVVTVLRGEHDFAIALGVVPTAQAIDAVGQEGFYYPWTEDALAGAEPTQLGSPLNFEQIAAVEPDVIVATTFQLQPDQFELLSAIAPTVGPPTAGVIPTWREVQRIFGQVLNRMDEAERVIDETDAAFAAVQEAHPEFVGASFTLPAFHLGNVSSAATDSQRYQFVKDLGLQVSDTVVAMEGSAFEGFEVGVERIDLVEADVVIWNTQMPDDLAAVPTREAQLPAAAERREIVLDAFLAAAIVQTNPLSIGYGIERMVPDLVAALDGDPETVPVSAARLYGGEASADEQAAMDAWEIAMDPGVPIADKRPHVEDFDALVSTFEAAIGAADAFGGIAIESKQATIDTGVATVTWDAVVGDGTITGQTATLDDVDGTWVARRADVCTYLELLGTPCPG
ncbi:MAG: ABC transporter substrate-binding protein [Actinomycetota bacterium]